MRLELYLDLPFTGISALGRRLSGHVSLRTGAADNVQRLFRFLFNVFQRFYVIIVQLSNSKVFCMRTKGPIRPELITLSLA